MSAENGKTPETDAAAIECLPGDCFEDVVDGNIALRLERERDELRELYALDTQCLRAERDEARAETEAIKMRLQTLRDEIFGAAPVSTADANITAIESGITALRMEIQAIRDALAGAFDKGARKKS
jgi:hypothetical protein